MRGRRRPAEVRLVDRVLSAHAYRREPVSRLLGEAPALAAMIGSALKFEEPFHSASQGRPVRSAWWSPTTRRRASGGYAQVDETRLAEALAAGRAAPADLLGEGFLALTIDQGTDMERYQGIVALDARGLSHSAHEYFASSEQVATRIRLAAGPFYHREAAGPEKNWRAGAIMIQHIARDGGLTGYREGEDQSPYTEEEENWNRAAILLDTVEDHELLDPELAPTRLLFRLFHEDGVRAFEPSEVEFSCHCSRGRMETVLRSFGGHEIDEMVQEGVITATCEFCSAVYVFTPEELKE